MWVRWRSFLSFFLWGSLLLTFSTWYYILWTNDNVSTSTQLSAAVLFTSPFHTFIISIYAGIFFYAECRPLHTWYAPIIQFILSIQCDVLPREVAKLSTYETFRPHTSTHTHFFPGVKYNFNFHNIFLVSSNFHPAGRQTLFFARLVGTPMCLYMLFYPQFIFRCLLTLIF